MARISFPTPETMSAAQRKIYDEVVAGPRGRVVGPLRAVLHNPALADPWQNLGRVLRYETCLPRDLNELAILITARRWSSSVEWAIHKAEAARAGLPALMIDDLEAGRLPDFTGQPAAAEIYEFSRQTLLKGDVDDAVYQAVMQRWGEVGVVELSSLIGYYTLVALTLNIHRVPLPDEHRAGLSAPQDGLFELPAFDQVTRTKHDANI